MWKSPDQSENIELDTASRLNQALRGDRGAGGMRQEVKRRSKESRGPGERMAELAGLYGKEKLGEGKEVKELEKLRAAGVG